MTFEEVVDQAITMLQRRKRVSYRMLKRQFDLDDAYLEDLTYELVEIQRCAADQDGKLLIWSGETATEPEAYHRSEVESRLYALLPDVISLLQREKRVTYRRLQYLFVLDDGVLWEIRAELRLRRLAVDEERQVLVWTGEAPSRVPTMASGTSRQDSSVSTEAIPSASPEVERRQLTVMFCDLVGSTDLSSKLDPEDLREIVRAYQETAAKVIERYEGYVAQYLGDGLLIYFGYPVAHEDDAQRAVHTGLGIVDAMGALNTRLEADYSIKLAVRLGIHTGPVVVGAMGSSGRHENLALGETPNIAARLEGMAQPNTVVISPVTAQLVQRAFILEELGPNELKGVAEPMMLYAVVNPREAEPDDQESMQTGGFEALVGRDEEIGLLLRRWEQSKEGLGQVVLISGEAGIGKSSLVEGLRRQVRQEDRRRMVFRCSPYHTNSAFYPIIEYIQRALGWQPGDAVDTKLSKLEQELGRTSLAQEEAVPLLAELLSLALPEGRYPGLMLSPQEQRQQTQDVLVAWLLEEAERQAVLAVWEDLHWADPSTLETLGLFVDQAPTASMLHVLTFRPEFEPPWSMRSHLTPIALSRLERPQVEVMIQRSTSGKTLPVEVVEHIADKTDGVPLFVEELTKMLLASELLREESDAYMLTGPLADMAIPDTLQDSLMARLDGLDTAKELAQLGAVLGRDFSYSMLQAISSQDEATLQAGLAQLVEAELLYQRGRPPRATYIFKHALIQDAAYASLLRRTRQQLHRQIAQVLEAQFAETATSQPELVAHHYTEADLHEPAIGYWQQAGARAVERSAHLEASHHLTQALACLATLPETSARHQRQLELQLALGPVLQATKGNSAPEVKHCYARARELCDQLPETPQLFPVLRGLRMYYAMRGELQISRELGEQLLHLAEDIQEPTYLSSAHWGVGASAFWFGQFFQARTHFEQAVTFYQAIQLDSLTFQEESDNGSRSLAWLSWTLWTLGYPNQALHRIHQALSLARELSNSYTLSHIQYFTAMFHAYRRDWQTAQIEAEASVTLATEQGFLLWRALARYWHGTALAAQGSGEEGITQMQETLVVLQSMGMGLNRSHLLALLAEAYCTTGKVDQGFTALTEALEIMATTGECSYKAEIYRLQGDLLLRQSSDHAAQAETSYCQALDVARSQHAKSWELRTAISLARLWHSQGKRQEACELLAPVYEWFTEGFDTADLKDAQALLDELSEGPS